MRRFADFLRQCDTATHRITNRNSLNDDIENRKLLLKLAASRVGCFTLKSVSCKMEREGMNSFPPFSECVQFIVTETKIACDTATSLHSLRGDASHVDLDKTERRSIRNETRRTVRGQSYLTETMSKSRFVPPNPVKLACHLCKKGNDLYDRAHFHAKSLCKRKAFVKENNLCFARFSPSYISRHFNQRKRCKENIELFY